MGFTRSIGKISVLSFASVLVSLANTLVIAYLFGVSREVEVFFAASQVFTVFVSLAQAGQLTEAFIPIFHQIKTNKSLSHAFSASSVLLNWIFLFASFFAVIIALFASQFTQILVPGFGGEEKLLVVSLVMLFCPLISIQVVLAFLKAIGHAQRLYGWPEAVGLVGNIVQFVVVIIFYRSGAWALAWGLVCGVVLQLLMMMALLYRVGYRHRFILFLDYFNAGIIFKRLLSTSFYVVCAQGAGVVMTASLSGLPQGVYGAYNYALRMYSKASSVLLRPISIVFFTNFSEAFARGEGRLKELAQQALSRTTLIIAMAFLAMVSVGDYFLSALLISEKFPIERIVITEQFLTAFTFTYFFVGFSQIIRKINVATGSFDSQYLLLGLAQLINAGFIVLLIPSLGLLGVNFVIVMQAVLPMLACGLLLYFRKKDLFTFYDVRLLMKWATAIGLALMVCDTVRSHVGGVIGRSRVEDLFEGSILLALSFLVALLIAGLLRVNELEMLRRFIKL